MKFVLAAANPRGGTTLRSILGVGPHTPPRYARFKTGVALPGMRARGKAVLPIRSAAS